MALEKEIIFLWGFAHLTSLSSSPLSVRGLCVLSEGFSLWCGLLDPSEFHFYFFSSTHIIMAIPGSSLQPRLQHL